MTTWEKLDDVSKSIAEEPWSLYWKEFKSGTDEFEQFLHNPLSQMTKAFEGVNREWTVQTNVIGHEQGLVMSVVCGVALVDPQKKTVFLTLYKHKPTRR